MGLNSIFGKDLRSTEDLPTPPMSILLRCAPKLFTSMHNSCIKARNSPLMSNYAGSSCTAEEPNWTGRKRVELQRVRAGPTCLGQHGTVSLTFTSFSAVLFTRACQGFARGLCWGADMYRAGECAERLSGVRGKSIGGSWRESTPDHDLPSGGAVSFRRRVMEGRSRSQVRMTSVTLVLSRSCTWLEGVDASFVFALSEPDLFCPAVFLFV
jgi:hypothetical protein